MISKQKDLILKKQKNLLWILLILWYTSASFLSSN